MAAADRDPEIRRARESRWLVGATIGLVLVGIVIGRWLVTPFDDWVPLAPRADLPAEVDPNELPQSARFECPAVLWGSGSPEATQQATEALEMQDLTREPCVDASRQHRAIAVVDLAVLGAAAVAVVLVVRRRRRGEGESTEPVTPAASDDSVIPDRAGQPAGPRELSGSA